MTVKVRWDNGIPTLTLVTEGGEEIDAVACVPGIDFDWTVGPSQYDIEMAVMVDRAIPITDPCEVV